MPEAADDASESINRQVESSVSTSVVAGAVSFPMFATSSWKSTCSPTLTESVSVVLLNVRTGALANSGMLKAIV